MNFTHLPNELLVNIVGRLDYKSVGSVFSVNRKFFTLVKVHRLYKPVAEEIRIKILEPSLSKPYYMLTVDAKIAPSEPRTAKLLKSPPKPTVTLGRMFKQVKSRPGSNGQQSVMRFEISRPQPHPNHNKNGKPRRKLRHSKVSEGQEEIIEEKLAEMIRKLALGQTKSLTIGPNCHSLNIVDLMKKTGISIDSLEAIYSETYMDTPYITEEHIKKLVANNTKRICFDKCSTGITFQRLLDYIEEHFEKMDDINWHFGVLTFPLDETFRLMVMMEDFKKNKTLGTSLRVKNIENIRRFHLRNKKTTIEWEQMRNI